MYWPEDDKTLVKTCSHIIYISNKPVSNCVDGKYIFN